MKNIAKISRSNVQPRKREKNKFNPEVKMSFSLDELTILSMAMTDSLRINKGMYGQHKYKKVFNKLNKEIDKQFLILAKVMDWGVVKGK
jgi:hypothetical protein